MAKKRISLFAEPSAVSIGFAVKVDIKDFDEWSPNQIQAFFRGLAEIRAACNAKAPYVD